MMYALIGNSFQLKKKVQYTRPVLNVPISKIKELPVRTYFTLITMSSRFETPSGEIMLIKKIVKKMKPHVHRHISSPLKPSQFRVLSDSFPYPTCMRTVITSLCTSIRCSNLSLIFYRIH